MELLERAEHLQRLGRALAEAARARGRIVAISGEAGAGKTALVEQFVADQAGDAVVYRGACEHLATPEPLLPLRDLFRAAGERFDAGLANLTLFERLLQILSRRTSVAVLEDVHWADKGTLDLIRFLARRVSRAGVLVLITYRDEEVGSRSALREVLGEAPAGSVERMSLEPLTESAVVELAARVGREGRALHALTGGNAFLVTEALAVPAETLSQGVRDATLARAAALPDCARAVLDAVSIFPRRVDLALVAAVAERMVPEDVDRCVASAMLVMDGSALRFRHELARRAIEESLSPTQRRRLHQRAVDTLTEDPAARASEVAHHAERAGDRRVLARYARLAGEYAASAGTPREAAAHFSQALAQRTILDEEQIVELLELCAIQSYLAGEGARAVETMAEATRMRELAGDGLALGRDLTRLTRFAWVCGRRAEAERSIARAITVLEARPESPELAWSYSHQAQLDMLASRNTSALAWAERAIALAEKLREPEVIIHALGTAGAVRTELDGPAGEKELNQSLVLARAGGYHDHVERAWCNLTCAAYWRRDFDATLGFVAEGAAYAAERDLMHWEAYLRGLRAMTRLDLGDWSEAEREAEVMSGWTSAATVFRFPALVALGRVRMRRGDADAEAPIATLTQLGASLNELQRDIYTGIIAAEQAWLGGDREACSRARTGLREVHARAIDLRVRWIESDAAFWLAVLSGDAWQGDRWREAAARWHDLGLPYEEAVALGEGDEEAQRRALTIFDRLGAAPAALRLRRQMRAAGARVVPRGPIAETRASPAGLTPRQTQVLSLIAEGLSNPEIADRLCISAKTAEHHVSAVMARLECTTRREAAATARRRGLLHESLT